MQKFIDIARAIVGTDPLHIPKNLSSLFILDKASNTFL